MISVSDFITVFPDTQYCERQSSNSFVAEPINTITNLAFFIITVYMWRLIKKKKIKNPLLKLFPLLIFLIGLGSTLYHTFQSPFAQALDLTSLYLLPLVSVFALIKIKSKERRIVDYFTGKKARNVIVVGILFIISLIAKYLDQTICPIFPLGTHFVLHFTVPVATYYALKFLIEIKLAAHNA